MNWYYSEGNQQKGPVSEPEFQQLLNSGTIQPTTLVWHEGMPDWQPYSIAIGPASSSPGLPPLIGGEIICVECGKSFPADEVIQYNGQSVCAACKPVFLQRIKEGAAPLRTPGMPWLSIEELLNRDYHVEISGKFGQAWKALNFKIVCATLLVLLLSGACGAVPFVGFLLQMAIQGGLMGGLWLTMLKQIRTQDAEVGEVFKGFGPRYTQLLLGNVIKSLLGWACMIPIAMATGLALPGLARNGHPMGSVLGGFGILIVLAGLVMIFLSTCWEFTLPLIVDKGLSFWPAMELSRKIVMKNWFMVFVALVFSWICGIIGALACGVGVLATIPVTYLMLAYIYEDIFGLLAPVKQ